MQAAAGFDLSPVLRMALVVALLACVPLGWLWLRQRGASAPARLRGLTLLALFLTFDLIVFGAFTRLTDSGLGCPDWPGCYGHASPVGASGAIAAEEAAVPSGAVTHLKAWIEMIHRYLAAAVGLLIVVLAVQSWRAPRAGTSVSPWWATATLLWVCAQGAFGAWTVTLKLYPAIVTLHLLGGVGLLALLAMQARLLDGPRFDPDSRALLGPVGGALLLVLVQVALGGWVSANYAVLACGDFPTCQGRWWPPADFTGGFTVLRPLGRGADGDFLPFAALTAIHLAHRIGAMVVFTAVGALAFVMRRNPDPGLRRWALAMAAVLAWQLVSGLANVVLGWPIAAALAHSAGAALLVAGLAALWASLRALPKRRTAEHDGAVGHAPARQVAS